MKALRTAKISAVIRWWAAACLALWLASSAAAAVPMNSCCNSHPEKSGCAMLERACCCQDEGLPGEPESALPVVIPPGTPDALPIPELGRLSWIAPELKTSELFAARSGDDLVPPELRLGSALWSHAPPALLA